MRDIVNGLVFFGIFCLEMILLFNCFVRAVVAMTSNKKEGIEEDNEWKKILIDLES